MKLRLFIFIPLFAFALLTPRLTLAGTLDDAPFRIVVPGSEWRISHPIIKLMGGDVSVAAVIINTNKILKTIVIKAVLKEQLPSSLDDLCAGMGEAMGELHTNLAVKTISEVDTNFLGFKAKAFTYQITKGERTIHNE